MHTPMYLRFLKLSCLAVLVLACPVWGEEVVVQNDSVSGSGELVIVGDFIEGEHAGVRLTSPCNGTIVAVQILWLEGTSGHGQSLEEAIHIYADGVFPVPGAELALLEGPVMTPGFWNEFRYLDEGQTTPINVPIGAGESFFVSLEFYNPTDVGGGGPSVVRDLNGCQANRNVLGGDIGLGWHWYNFCLLLQGDLAIRAVVDCPGATGACCYPNGTCADEVEQDECQAEFGAVWHEGETCGEITCTPRGACCRAGGCLQLAEQAACEAIGGVFAGAGSDCNDGVCVTGACCLPDGSCSLEFEFACDALGGVYEGHGTSCVPNPCPQPEGACCFGEFCFEDQTQADCAGTGGDWLGAGTDCGPPNPCVSPGCAGDMNCDGVVDYGDIDPFVAALSCVGGDPGCWDPACPWLNGDCNNDGNVTYADIDAFVGRIGATCP